ncbi:very short patch repair endonuclease [Fundidesulfovibrio butyratiphilus]
MDIFTKEKRSEIMRKVKSKDTGPEKKVRSMLHSLGYRFRLHRKDLPGTPDIVLPKYKTIIFVHGCFWHGHPGCTKSKTPKTNAEFWNKKISNNIENDRKNLSTLSALGWNVVIIWECQVNKDLKKMLLDVIK